MLIYANKGSNKVFLLNLEAWMETMSLLHEKSAYLKNFIVILFQLKLSKKDRKVYKKRVNIVFK